VPNDPETLACHGTKRRHQEKSAHRHINPRQLNRQVDSRKENRKH
jgi:hypothetical protein